MTDFFVPANVVSSRWMTSGSDMIEIDTSQRVLVQLLSSDTTGINLVVKDQMGVINSITNPSVLTLNISGGVSSLISTKTGTGTYLPFAISVGGSNALQIDTSQNIGMGTTAPSVKLHTKIGADGYAFYVERSSGAIVGVGVSTTTGKIGTQTNHPLQVVTNNTLASTWDISGNFIHAHSVTISGTLTVNSSVTTGSLMASGSSANSFTGTGSHAITTFQNAAGNTFKIHLGTTSAASDNYIGMTTANNIGILINNTVTHALFATGNITIGGTTDAGYKLDVIGTARFNNDVIFDAAVSLHGLPMTIFSTLKVGSITAITSCAVLECVSTTTGLLLPRMTTAQRDAISSPVAGLTVYNTTTNKLNVYTSAWEAVTSA